MPILRSRTQAALLTVLFMDPDREFAVSELAARVGTSLPTAAREVTRAERAGVLVAQRVGRSKLVKADTESYVFEPLRDLLLRSFGPVAVIAEEFSGIKGLDRIFIFGSWAARYLGQQGDPPRDIDVLAIGGPDRDDVNDAADRAERRLQRPVQVTLRSNERWNEPNTDEFLRQVRNRPLIEIADRGRPSRE
ncbi:MAG TPA: ArsR family transcriptional regulator [Actinomycetota bacterium]|jgi:hypothetical protein|nr:ArsR family transcriptional regulator [Actinomycetota bacterium]